jgi:hypothetical protein
MLLPSKQVRSLPPYVALAQLLRLSACTIAGSQLARLAGWQPGLISLSAILSGFPCGPRRLANCTRAAAAGYLGLSPYGPLARTWSDVFPEASQGPPANHRRGSGGWGGGRSTPS